MPSRKTFKVAVLVNLAKNAPSVASERVSVTHDALADLDSEKTGLSYVAALRARGHEAVLREGGLDLPAWLAEFKPDICLNTCEGFIGDSREAQVPALLEMIGNVRYTGPGPLAAAVTQDKPTTKQVLHYYGLPTPLFQVFATPHDPVRVDLRYPLFVKPKHEGTGMGVKADSIVRTAAQLRDRVAWVIDTYQQPALVESYIEGLDITCGLTGNGDDVHFFPITEVDFSGYPPEIGAVYGSLHKIEYDEAYRNKCPAPLDDYRPGLSDEIRTLTHQVFLRTGCRDYGRVDFRLDADYNPHILEINGLPGIAPRSDLTLMAEAEGLTHTDLVNMVLDAGLKRYGLI
ncbi:MAG: hypothetical protein K1X39_07460 [Thermoflexales bacterium]|nr:hypothetical protein [Thermoflexales bacterium]